MNEHVLGLLEFPKVCEMLAQRASSARGRRIALILRPVSDRAAAETGLDLVRQMREAYLAGFDPGPVEIGELEGILPRLSIEGDLLQPDELLRLKSLLAVSTRARAAFTRPEVASRHPGLGAIGARFGDFAAVLRRLDEVFDPAGGFLDTASPGLASVRRRLRETRAEAGEALGSLARRESTHPEETFVTIREGRYVLAVRSTDRSRLPGIVHSRSGSGQTVFLEPLQAVERNNAIAELEGDEREECLEILRELDRAIRARASEIREAYEASADLDLLRARMRLAIDLGCAIPAFNDGERVRLVACRHPLLAETERTGGAPVVPLDLDLSGEGRTLVLSGPNMGGKTVALKTVGLLVAMAQASIPVPAGEGTELPVVDAIFADLGDEQSIEQETSTFAGHLRNLALAWEGTTGRSLVLLDELGGGTDPDEGTALGRALLELLTDRGPFVLATTHLSGLKMVAHEHPRMVNAAMEFDPTTQQPTYRLRIGSPGRSRAFELARRMLPPGELLDRAESYRSPWSARLDDLLGEIERRRADLDAEIDRVRAAEASMREAQARKEQQAGRLRQRLHAIRDARWEATGAALREAERVLAEVKRIRAEAEEARSATRDAEVEARRRTAEGEIAAARERLRRPSDPHLIPLRPEEVGPGMAAYSADLRSMVRVDSEPDVGRRVWIWHGAIRFQVPLSSLVHPPATAPEPEKKRLREPVRGPDDDAPVDRQIDVRGHSAAEGLEIVERYIDRAAVAAVPEVRIIHGKGKGILKREIEEFLSASPLVESFRTGEPHEGGWGATIVRLRPAQVGA